MDLLLTVLVGLTVFTLAYKFVPYRTPGKTKPLIALLPKYRKRIRIECTANELESRLASYGFSDSGTTNGITYYHRGSLLGDFSTKLIKVKLGIAELEDGMSDITMEASWVVAFDTGDFWSFITELSSKLESA
jgi:hypothetical protein